jgi:glycine/D-amino acid oxidase-like deaminating enzyme
MAPCQRANSVAPDRARELIALTFGPTDDAGDPTRRPLDGVPVHVPVVYACSFSGQGFAFATVMGKALADRVEHEPG